MLTWKWLFGLVAIVALTVAVHELTGAFANRGIRLARTPLYLGVAGCSVAAYLGGALWLTATFGVLVLATMFWRLRRGADGYVRDTTASVFVAGYLPLMAGFVMLMLRAEDGPERIIAFIVLTICSDIGGYAAGVLFGRHPIAPQISPKKSWEGLVGSFSLQAVAGVLLFVLLFDAAWWQGLVTGLVMTVVATMGDFTESAIKRDLGRQGHGDRPARARRHHGPARLADPERLHLLGAVHAVPRHRRVVTGLPFGA